MACVAEAFHAVARLAKADVAVQTRLGEELDACALVTGALRNLSSEKGCSGIRANGCMALQALADDNESNKIKLGEEGACELVLDALRAGADDDDIVIQACLAVCDANKSKLGAGIQSLIEVLHIKPDHEYAWLAISALADNYPPHQRELEGKGVVSMALQTARNAEASQIARQRALQVMAHRSELRKCSQKLAAEGACAIAVDLAKQLPPDEDTTEWAIMLISNLAETDNTLAMGAGEDLFALLGKELRALSEMEPSENNELHRNNLNAAVRYMSTDSIAVLRLSCAGGFERLVAALLAHGDTQERELRTSINRFKGKLKQLAKARDESVAREAAATEAVAAMRAGDLTQQLAAKEGADGDLAAARKEMEQWRTVANRQGDELAQQAADLVQKVVGVAQLQAELSEMKDRREQDEVDLLRLAQELTDGLRGTKRARTDPAPRA
ncbi:hypothetical protein JKP88DRAFT_281312 [Tribonema minus]|uniref:Uncharacterized protein n=1 Tax=Tribonema minus TaxID=303371 RepID=A0A835YPE1_9STRA|nr:hypothetical protein JKP88DRAFT_281312 [Tribonema minus]